MDNSIDIKEKEEKRVELPYRDLAEAKTKTDIFLNISDDDKKKLINLNSWAVKALELSIIERVQKKNMRIRQGEVWSVDLGENIGAEMNKVRPCIVLSCDIFNDSSMATIIPITNSKTDYPSQVKLEDLGVGDLITGTAKGEQIRTVSKARFGKRICMVSDVFLLQEALMKHLGISKEIIDILNASTNNESLKLKIINFINENLE